MRYFINLHLKMLIGIGIQWYSNFLTTIFLIGLTSSYMYMYSIRFSSVSKKLCKINKLVWDKRHYSVSFFWPFLSLWLLFSLMHFSFVLKKTFKIFWSHSHENIFWPWSSIWPWPHFFFLFCSSCNCKNSSYYFFN